MPEFLNFLQSLDPGINSGQANELGCVFAAINQQTLNVADSTTWSLNRWLQWLDDEGFDCNALMGTLNSLGIAATGQQAWDHLSANLRTHVEDTDGLGLLQEMLEREDPELLARLHTLETVALREDLILAQTAGGLSKAAKDTLYGVGGIATVGAVLGIRKAWKKNRQIKELAECEAREQAKVEDYVKHDLEMWKALARVTIKDGVMSGPEDAVKLAKPWPDNTGWLNRKNLIKYGEADIVRRAQVLAAEHVDKYFYDHFVTTLKSIVMDREEFRSKLQTEAIRHRDHFEFNPELSSEELKEAEQAILQGDTRDRFDKQVKALEQDKSLRMKLEYQFFNDHVKHYRFLVSREVEVAKKAAKKEGYELTNNPIQQSVRFSEIQVDKEVAKLVEQTEKQIREAASAAERAAKAAERDIRNADDMVE